MESFDFWKSKNVTVLGGAGFIGSHLVEKLLELDANVVVVDDLSSGNFGNVPKGVLFQLDCRNFGNCVSAMLKADVVFHLAAASGGRGYLESHAIDVWNNLEIDATVFRAATYAGVKKVVYFSSSCAYPDYDLGYYDEDLIDYNKIEQADGAYGMAKLIGEHMLNAYVQAGKFDGIAVRPFNVFGPRMKENKAMTALIAKAFIKQDPFEIWGDGRQKIDWIYVDDVVDGALLAAEKMSDGAINLGTGNFSTPRYIAELIFALTGWTPKDVFLTYDKNGLQKRSDSIKLYSLGWKQKTSLVQGITNTIEWYYVNHSAKDVCENFERKLLER